MEVSIPYHHTLLEPVPKEERPKGEEELKFWKELSYELTHMIRHAALAKDPQIVLNPVRTAGEQHIWEFYVNDLSKPKTAEQNWHGQNVSQWLYAGCIMLTDGKVSTHH